MNLDKVTAVLRPRSPWEAADFGVRLVRRDAAAVYKVWFATSLPLLLLAIVWIYATPWPGLALLLYWWFEPVLDGPILDVIARRLFGGDADVGTTVRRAPAFAWRNRLFLLTPKRLHFARSVAMPITQLEQLSGATRRQRSKVLNTHVLNHGMGVTVAYHHLWSAAYFGIILGFLAFIPPEYRLEGPLDWLGYLSESDDNHAKAANLLLFYFAQSLLQPWFVGAGFGLYINCRTRLEAWDIELVFRRMATKRTAATATAVTAAMMLAAGLAVSVGSSAAYAQEDSADGSDPGFAGFWTSDDIADELDAVFETEALNTMETRKTWVRKNPESERTSSGDNSAFREAMRSIGELFALIVEFGFWILAALVVLFVFLTRQYWLPYLLAGSPVRQRSARVMLASGEVRAEELPDDVPASVRALWQRGDRRAALSLLYRASVFELVRRYGVRLPRSATEGGCLAAVAAQTGAAQSGLFRRIVNAWVMLAYGARVPSTEEVESLLSAWPEQYGEASS